MVRTWYGLSVDHRRKAKAPSTGVPLVVGDLRRALAVLSNSASPQITQRYNAALAALSASEAAIYDASDGPNPLTPITALEREALNELPVLADAVVPEGHQYDGLYRLGAVLAVSAAISDNSRNGPEDVSLRTVACAARRISVRDRTRLESVSDLLWLADEYRSCDETTLRRNFIGLAYEDLTVREIKWRLNPARWWLVLFDYHSRILDELRRLPRTPSWDSGMGELYFDGRLIRKVVKKATDVRAILDAFQACGWKRVILHPRTESVKPKSRILTLRNNHTFSINEGIAPGTIRFGGGGEDHLIKWELDAR